MEKADFTTNITVLIGGRTYALKINKTDEIIIRRIVKDINDRFEQFQANYPKKDKIDCLSMAFLAYAAEINKNPASNTETAFLQKLHQIDELLDQVS